MGAHGHFCFDGEEPPVSIHLDNVGIHGHDASSSHNDIDVDLSQSVIAKLLKFDSSLPLLLAAIVVFWVIPPTPFFFSSFQAHHRRRIVGLHPLLRAPPVNPA